MKYRIHYGALNNDGDIPCLEYDAVEEVIGFITSIIYPIKRISDKVYLIAFDDDIVVTDDALLVDDIFSDGHGCYSPYESDEIFIQEYPSYEDAYKVALMMRETSHLCYNKEKNII